MIRETSLAVEDAPLALPEQFERRTDVVAWVQKQLVLARPLEQTFARPWEKRTKVGLPSRCAMPRIVAQLGTPAKPPKRRRKSPGRALNASVKPASCYPVVRKSTSRPLKQHKPA